MGHNKRKKQVPISNLLLPYFKSIIALGLSMQRETEGNVCVYPCAQNTPCIERAQLNAL